MVEDKVQFELDRTLSRKRELAVLQGVPTLLFSLNLRIANVINGDYGNQNGCHCQNNTR